MTVASDLARLGWRTNTTDRLARAVRDFQRGWNLGPALLVDGKAGPKTKAALKVSVTRRRTGRQDASDHFSFRDFACKCGGRYGGCARIRVQRALLQGLEEYRAAAGVTRVVSGYRCPAHNARVGGASMSQHVYGSACDLELRVGVLAVRRMRRFSGIGRQGLRVRHVDVRHLSGNNTTGGTPERPTIWRY